MLAITHQAFLENKSDPPKPSPSKVETSPAKLFKKAFHNEIIFNEKAGSVGKDFFGHLAKSLKIDKTSAGIPVTEFTFYVTQFTGLNASKKVQATKFDVAPSGFINEKEAQKYFRNILMSYAKTIAFKNGENGKIPSFTGSNIKQIISDTAKNLVITRGFADKLFEKESVKGPVTPHTVLTLFKITRSGEIPSNNLNKDQFYKLFRGLIKASYREHMKTQKE